MSWKTAQATWRDLEIELGHLWGFQTTLGKKKALLLFQCHYICMWWCEPVHSITQGNVVVYTVHQWRLKEKDTWDGVSLSRKLSVSRTEEAAWWHFYLCCADSARLSLQEADEEEWPCGRTTRVHLYLSSSSESRTAESAAPPHGPPPPRRWEITCLHLPDTLSVCSQSTHPPSATHPLNPVSTGRWVLL